MTNDGNTGSVGLGVEHLSPVTRPRDWPDTQVLPTSAPFLFFFYFYKQNPLIFKGDRYSVYFVYLILIMKIY